MAALAALLLCIGGAFPTCGQTAGDASGVEMSAGGDDLHAPLHLVTGVVEQRYCSDRRVRLKLLLTYTNAGKGPLILDKRSSVVPRYTFSRTIRDAERRRYDLVGRSLILLDAPFMSTSSTLDEANFVTLRPGESYSMEGAMSFPFSEGRGGDGDSLPPGQYVLQVETLTWYYPKASNVRWRERWRDKGYLRSDSVISAPSSVTVKRKPPVVECRPTDESQLTSPAAP